MTGAADCDVAVVGYGPTGATLANLLAQCGLRVVVLERETGIYHLPRAVHFDDETMRVFQTVGIADQLRRKVRVNPGMRFVDGDGTLLLNWPRPRAVGPQGWHASFRLHQPDLESLLRTRFESRPKATALTQCEVTGLNDTGNGVTVTYRDRAAGATGQLRAGWVVGCDGARSFVRQAIGSGTEDLGFRERWLVIDVVLKRPRPDLGDHSVQFCNPDRPMTYCRSPGRRRRWEITVLEHESDDEVTRPERVWQFLSRWIGPDDADLERASVYTFQSAVAESWASGRLLIAGDAAHLTPPFMGQGMCAGIRDAANLGWKLALLARGRAPAGLLESYQRERSPHVREYITTAMRLGLLINALDRSRALEMAKAGPSGGARLASIAPRLGASGFASRFPDEAGAQGVLFGQPVLSGGRRMDDVTGYEPVLVSRTSFETQDVGLTVLNGDDEPSVRTCLEDLGADSVLIRPDRYILASARTADGRARLAEAALPSPLPA